MKLFTRVSLTAISLIILASGPVHAGSQNLELRFKQRHQAFAKAQILMNLKKVPARLNRRSTTTRKVGKKELVVNSNYRSSKPK